MSKRPTPLTSLINRGSTLSALSAEARRHKASTAKIAAMLPPDLAPHCRAVVERDRLLIIYVDSPAWATRFRFLAPQLAKRMTTSGRPPKVAIRILPEHVVTERPLQPAVRSNSGASDIRAMAASVGGTPLARALEKLANALSRR